MKKFIGKLSLLSLLISGSAFAGSQSNVCLQNPDEHIFGSMLVLNQCDLKDRDMPQVLSLLASNPDIDSLVLEENKIGPDGAKIISNANIKTIYFGLNPIGDEGAAALAKNKSLVLLTVEGDGIGDKGIKALAQSKSLAFLAVDDNYPSASAIQALANNKNLQILILGQAHLDDAAVHAFAKNTSLQYLWFADSDLSLKSLSALANMSGLIGFGLMNSEIGDAGAKIISENSNLKYVALSRDDIGVEGAAALTQLPNLGFLGLSYNHIGDQGARFFASPAAVPALTELDLSANNLTDAGVSELAKNSRLDMLFLRNNNTTNAGALALAVSGARYTMLELSYNHIGPSGISALVQKHIPYLFVFGNDGSELKKAGATPDFTQSRMQFMQAYCQRNSLSGCVKYTTDKLQSAH